MSKLKKKKKNAGIWNLLSTWKSEVQDLAKSNDGFWDVESIFWITEQRILQVRSFLFHKKTEVDFCLFIFLCAA